MNTNPIDEALARGEEPDYTKYSKRVVMPSDHFRSVVMAAQKAQDEEDKSDFALQAELKKSREFDASIVRELVSAGYSSIAEFDDIKATPQAQAKAIEILTRKLPEIDDPAHAWGVALLIKQLKPRDAQPLVGTIKQLLARDDLLKYLQVIYNLALAVRSSKDQDATHAVADMLRQNDSPALQGILRKLESKRRAE